MADWVTMTDFKVQLYHTKASDNYEFEISSGFYNPCFFVFWNAIRYRGYIAGLKTEVNYVSGTRYKVVPMVRTCSQTTLSYTVVAGNTKSILVLPTCRWIRIYGALLSTFTVGAFKGTINLYFKDSEGNVVQSFPAINKKNGKNGLSYIWEFVVPQSYYSTGGTLLYESFAESSPASTDLFFVEEYTDDAYEVKDNVFTYVGVSVDTPTNAEFTILVTEKGEHYINYD